MSRSSPVDDQRSVRWSALSMTSTTGRGLRGEPRPGARPDRRAAAPPARPGPRHRADARGERLEHVAPERGRVVVVRRRGSASRPARPAALACPSEAASVGLARPRGPAEQGERQPLHLLGQQRDEPPAGHRRVRRLGWRQFRRQDGHPAPVRGRDVLSCPHRPVGGGPLRHLLPQVQPRYRLRAPSHPRRSFRPGVSPCHSLAVRATSGQGPRSPDRHGRSVGSAGRRGRGCPDGPGPDSPVPG